ncbi:NADH-quinone oxidoreductase subunit G [Granulicoccus phenolivorans]|uniref:NADH-quinone oxidoreductase subunit G n=1 Tax=Granulicoccus phenolivorans TaxID=266854 RepID=UPI000409B6DE|nr:NADH-quinone oxidoreductase subunit G [Granulicoccus phenolivorans]
MTEVANKTDEVTCTIDGIEISVPKGTLVIRAAEQLGIQIPKFCDHPLLDPVGACRQCMVDVTDDGRGRPMPKPQASCTITCMPGMQIETGHVSAKAEKAQAGMLEFLLMNHPLDCPICDKGGECPLQNQSLSNGAAESRYDGVKRTFPKPINVSKQILLDRERCVLCARCTRFSEQISGDPFIALVERGALQQVGFYEDQPYNSYFSGNTIQICPVGALTSAKYRFRSRPFDLKSQVTTCEHCASGCELRVDQRRSEVLRRYAGDAPEVNEEWNCDKGRFGFEYGRGEDRITRPLIREGDVLRPASWPEAINAAVRGLQQAGAAGDHPYGVLTGGRLTVEDAYAYAKFARVALGTNNIDFRSRPHTPEESAFLAQAVAGTGLGTSYADLEHAATVLLVDLEPEDESPMVFLRLRKAYRKNRTRVFTLAPYASAGTRKMGGTVLPTVPGTEADVLDHLDPTEVPLDANSVVLVGERAATSPGALTAVLDLVHRTGAKLAWVPRRAGDRGAIEAGCLPNLLPGGRPVTDAAARVDVRAAWGTDALPSTPGRDGDQILAAVAAGELKALVVAGVEPADLRAPATALAALENVDFLISLETRISEVTARADVVFPVSLFEEREGTFLDWEGRERPVHPAVPTTQVMSDLRVLAALADALGTDLGIRSAAEARTELAELGVWAGARPDAPNAAPLQQVRPGPGEAILASWRELIDDSRGTDHAGELLATARPTVIRMNLDMANGLRDGSPIKVAWGEGQITLSLEIASDMVDGVVWVPRHPLSRGTEHASLGRLGAINGELVRIWTDETDPAFPAGGNEGDPR